VYGLSLLTRCQVPQPPGPRFRIAQDAFLIAEWQNDPATINKESTNENNTDVDRWADARWLRINGKPLFLIVILHRQRNADQEMLWRWTRYALALDD
jgi:hypothetical protein